MIQFFLNYRKTKCVVEERLANELQKESWTRPSLPEISKAMRTVFILIMFFVESDSNPILNRKQIEPLLG